MDHKYSIWQRTGTLNHAFKKPGLLFLDKPVKQLKPVIGGSRINIKNSY
jgi:hypothetical protein